MEVRARVVHLLVLASVSCGSVASSVPSDASALNDAVPVTVLASNADVAELVVATGTTDDDEANLVAYLKSKLAL